MKTNLQFFHNLLKVCQSLLRSGYCPGKQRSFVKLFVLTSALIALNVLPVFSQCDVEVSGVMAYCNAVRGNSTFPGYFIGFRIQSNNGDTLNVVDLTGNVPMNLGKRIDDINTQSEPSDTSRAKVKIAGGLDSLEFWYFGPFMDGDSFNIVLIDPEGICDTIEVASGTFTCQGQDPNACSADVPLYYLDFSLSEWNIGGGGSSNENFDQVFLIMQRSRVATCCQVGNSRCFEFIITLDEDDIGLLIDDVGSGSTGGNIYADSLNGFMCGTSQSNTWPYFQDNGQSADEPLCLSGTAREWIVLSCKEGNNVTGVSFGTVGSINVLPEYVYSDCTVGLEVLNASSATWTSPDDPNLDNLINFSANNLSVTFSYDESVFGPVTSCDGDTFTYYVGGLPDNDCLPADSILYDTTFVVVYPGFSISIDSTCLGPDSILLEAALMSGALNCDYQIEWSTGDTSTSIIIPNLPGEYWVSVIREDIDSLVRDCSPAIDVISIVQLQIECLPDQVFNCIGVPPPANTGLITISGCGINPLITSEDFANNGTGCGLDSFIVSRYYIVDFDGDTINTITDKDTCLQRFVYVDDKGPIIQCPANITLGCFGSTLPENTGGYATAVDECDSLPEVSFIDVVTPGSCPREFSIVRTWTAVDDCGNSSTCDQLILIDDNSAPSVSCPPNITIQCTGDTSPANTGNAAASDECDPSPIISYMDSAPSGNCPAVIIRTWTATDDCGNTGTCTQTISLLDTVVPQITCPPDITLLCSSNTDPSSTGTATGTDNCDLTLTVSHTNSQVTGSCPQNIIITRTWRVTDDCSNSSTCVQTLTLIDDLAPVIVCPPDITIECLEDTSPISTGAASATDNCDPNAQLTYFDTITGGNCPVNFTISRTWRAEDDCGNFSTCIQSITVKDDIAPVIACPANITIQCNESTLPPSTGSASVTDNCDINVQATYTDSVTNGTCPQEFTILRTWAATDACGNSSSCVQTIAIQDIIPPVIICPANVTINYQESALPDNTGAATATDNCDTLVALSYIDSLSPACVEQNLIIRAWMATDDCGNTNTCQQTILIEDHGTICGVVEDDFGQGLASVTLHLMEDINNNGLVDGGDTLFATTLSAAGTGSYCFTDIKPCNYIIVEVQPPTYGDLFDFDSTPDPDGNDSLDGPDNEIPVSLLQGENDSENNFTDIVCALTLPAVEPDTLCENDSTIFEVPVTNQGAINYMWNFGSGASPGTASGLGPHTVTYISTPENQASGASVTLTLSKAGCPDTTGQISTVQVNEYPDASINGSTANLCYYTNRTFQPVTVEIPGATYEWDFGANAIPATANGYGPHVVYYTVAGPKAVQLVIYPNAAGAQCPDSSTINFNVTNCPGNITGFVRSTLGAGIAGVNIKLFTDNDTNGIADNATVIRNVFSTANGSYSMVGLTPGNYVIIQTQPPGWFTVDDEDMTPDGDLASNIDSLDNLIPSTLGPSEIDGGNLFVETAEPGTIQGSVFIDDDGDEFPDAGEGISEVVIELYSDDNKDGLPDNGTPLDTAITTSAGHYNFSDVSIGNYVLIQIQSPEYISIKDFDASNDQDSVANTNTLDDIIPVTVINQENDQHNYFIDQHECSLLVTNANDDGPGSVRFMLQCGAAGDTIYFDSILAGQTIMITSGEIEIDQDLVIISNCVPRVTIESTVGGLFDIAPGRNLSFSGFDIISGTGGHAGAAFYNFGILTLNDMNVYRNSVLPPGDIMIRNTPGSQLLLNNTNLLLQN